MSSHASAQEHFRQGREDLRDEALDRALAHFRTAHRLDPGSAQYRSFYGLVLGLCERHWERALELCRSAARDEFFDPIHYHNLACLHLAFGFKAEALRLLRRGLMIAPDHEEILTALRDLGSAGKATGQNKKTVPFFGLFRFRGRNSRVHHLDFFALVS